MNNLPLLKIGTDIVSVKRIKQLYEKYDIVFANKILTQQEINYFYNSGRINMQFLAKRFAGKEAVVKALGTGFTQHTTLKDITIISDDWGKPKTLLSSRTHDFIFKLYKISTFNIDISLSDDREFAMATAIFSA